MMTARTGKQTSDVLQAWRMSLRELRMPGYGALAPSDKLFLRFAVHYQAHAALPRPDRRALQRRWKHSLAGVALLMALGQVPAQAANIQVGGACTLIQAIDAANKDTVKGGCPAGSGPDTIILPANSTFTLTAIDNTVHGATGLPLVTSEIVVKGNGSEITRSSTAPHFRIMAVGGSGDLTLENVTLSGGNSDGSFGAPDEGGGGILNYRGKLALAGSTVTRNLTQVLGGGIKNYLGVATLVNSTVSDNSFVGSYGMMKKGAGIYNRGTITLTNSTISGNTSAQATNSNSIGIAIFNAAGETVNLVNSTISGNTGKGSSNASSAPAIYNGVNSVVNMKHTTVFNNRDFTLTGIAHILNEGTINATDCLFLAAPHSSQEVCHNVPTVPAVFNSYGVNIVSHLPFCSNDVIDSHGTPLLMGPLQNNGGSTQTNALLPGNIAIDAITDGSCPPPGTDQRGVIRPQDGDGDGTAACDVGAYEQQTDIIFADGFDAP